MMKCQNIKTYKKIRTSINIPPDDNKLGTFEYFSQWIIMFIDKIDLSNSSIEIKNPVCHRLVSNNLRIL